MTNTTEPVLEGNELEDWYPRHIVAMTFQTFSLIGSLTIIASFFILKNRRSPFHFEILFLNIADFVWTSSHFINHAEALSNNHVTHNHVSCTVMGMFTHLGIGWELCWLISISLHSALVIKNAAKGRRWEPSKNLMIAVTIFGWGFPLIWWVIVGVSLDAYASTGYFCWVKFEPIYISLLFGDIPLFICFLIVTASYSYVIFLLVRVILDKKYHEFTTGGVSFKQEIQRSIGYIIVYALWVHPYLAITIIVMAGGVIPRGFWLYFLALINSLGTMNFFAYGISERWYKDIKIALGYHDVDSHFSRGSRSKPTVSLQDIDVTVEKAGSSSHYSV